MQLNFVYHGYPGRVSVSCERNDDPAALGLPEASRGFPACTATVAFAGRGYHALFGWMQLVRSTDNATQGHAFEMDPFVLFAESDAPYCWYGTTPTLFDAPMRADKRRLDWVAHSFLAVTPLDELRSKLIVPLLGFAWGFESDAQGTITIRPLQQLTEAQWAAHVPYLRRSYPTWTFRERFHMLT